EMDSNFRFLVVRPSNRHGRRDCCLENGSGSVGEPKVRIHLPPAGSLLRTDFQGTGPPPGSGCLVCLLRCGRCRVEFAVALLDPSRTDMALYRHADMVRAIAWTCRVPGASMSSLLASTPPCKSQRSGS